MTNINDVGGRIKKARKSRKMSQEALAKELDLTHASISHMEGNKSGNTVENIVRIAKVLGVSVGWLAAGEGEMEKGQTQPVVVASPYEQYHHGVDPMLEEMGRDLAKIKPDPQMVAKSNISPLPPMVTVDNEGVENITYVSTKAQAGYPTLFQEPEFFRNLPTFNIPLPRYKNATFRAWEVTGPSMQPALHAGALAISQYVDNWHRGAAIKNGYIHVVVTKDNVVIKRVIDHRERGYFGLMSDNEEFATYNVPLEDVLELWYVPGAVVSHFPNTRFNERRKISKLESGYVELEERIAKLERRITA